MTLKKNVQDINGNTYKGRSLFNDIEDEELRARNRACILRNILAEYELKPGEKLTAECTLDVVGYFNKIPVRERKPVLEKFRTVLQEQGFYAEVI